MKRNKNQQLPAHSDRLIIEAENPPSEDGEDNDEEIFSDALSGPRN